MTDGRGACKGAAQLVVMCHFGEIVSVIRRIDIENLASSSDFSGVVSIRTGQADLHRVAFGFRDVQNHLRNETTTRFGIASGTKLFTAIAVGWMIDRKMISLDTTMVEIDKEYHGFIDENATIRHLLTHYSGIFDYYDEESVEDFESFKVEIPWHELRTPTDYLPLFKNRHMKYRSGERYSYSNGGYVLLGIVIEKMTGELFRDFLEARVLRPLEMYDSGFFAFNDLPPNTANGYMDDGRTSNIYNLPIRGGGDGGMYATVENLDRFWDGFLGNKILSKETTSAFLSTRHQFNDEHGYGCGMYKSLDDNCYSIIGCDAGVGFFSAHYCQNDMTVSVLSNRTNGEHEMVKMIINQIKKDT